MPLGGGVDGVEVYWADSTWAAENNWHQAPLREIGLPDINTNINPRVPGARFNLSSRSTWSTGEKLPLGVLTMGGGDSSLGSDLANRTQRSMDLGNW